MSNKLVVDTSVEMNIEIFRYSLFWYSNVFFGIQLFV